MENENTDVCVKCEREIILNPFTKKFESDDFDWPAMCMPADWDGVIRDKPHSPKRTYTPPPKPEAQIVTNMMNMATAWGWPVPATPPNPASETPESSGEPPSPRVRRGCASYSEYHNAGRPAVDPEVPPEHLEMPLL